MEASSNSPEVRLELMTRAFAAFNDGDIEAFVPLLAPGVFSHVAPGLANAGSWQSDDGFMEMLRSWVEPWSVIEMVPGEPEFLDDRNVVVRVEQSAEGAGSGVPVELTVYMALDIHSGQLHAIGIFPERGEAIAWFDERGAGPPSGT